MVCQIMKEYKGFKIGELVKIPKSDYRVIEYYGEDNIVEITDFSPENDIIHWKKKSIYGGIGHSGNPSNEIEKLSLVA